MKKRFSFFMIVLVLALAIVPGCGGDSVPETVPPGTIVETPPEPSAEYTNLSNQISGIDSSSKSSLADILRAINSIDLAEGEGNISETEAGELDDELKAQFNAWVKETVDDIDPTKPEAIKDFFDMQAVQRSSEYDENVDPATKQYKEGQMADKFNQWVRNRVDDIDPSEPGALKDMFDLQVIQRTGKYDELATEDTHEYKEEQMGEKLNEWVRNRVNEIDPTEADNLKYFFWLQTIQASEKYDEFATPETHEWKESEMKRKFNEWVENRVNDLDPDDPNFLEELEKLIAIQQSDKYDRFITTLMHEWKESTLREKMDQYTENLVNKLNPLSPTFWEDLAKLIELQLSDVYKNTAAQGTKDYKLAELTAMLTSPFGPPPTVAGSYPQIGQAGVALDQSIMIVFDQPMEPVSLETAIEVSPSLTYTTTPMLEETFIILLRPLEPLSEETTYTVTVNQEATSFVGIPLLETYEFNFTTKTAGPAPGMINTSPEDGAVGDRVGQPIAIEFDQAMSTASVEAYLSISPDFAHSFIWIDDTQLIIQSHDPLTANKEYTVTVGSGARSADGIPIDKVHQFSFIPSLMNIPDVLGVMPDQGQDDIPSNHPIQIVFDRSMNTRSVEARLSISPAYKFTTNWYEADMVLEIVPETTLPSNTELTITLESGALSSFGLPMEDSFKFSFTTAD